MKKGNVVGVAAVAVLLLAAVGMFAFKPVFDYPDGDDKGDLDDTGNAYGGVTVSEAGSVLSVDNGRVALNVDLASGGIDFYSRAAGRKMLENFYPTAEIGGKTISGADYGKVFWTHAAVSDSIGKGCGVSVIYEKAGMPTLIQHILSYEGRDYVVLELEIVNTAFSDIAVSSLNPITVDPSFGGYMEFTASEGALLAFVNGYQSWDYAGVVRVTGTALDQGYSSNDNGFQLSDCSSWWAQTLFDEPTGLSVTAGTLTFEVWKTRFSYKSSFDMAGSWTVSCGGNGEKLAVASGGSLASEKIFLASSRAPTDDLSAYGELAGRVNNAREVFEPPMGWCSWYYYFDKISEAEVVANAEELKTLSNVPYEYIQIDDGWQGLWGDWMPNEKFPSGMDGTAKKIHDLGFKAGLWLAPFLMNPTLPTAIGHPDWFIRDEAGNHLTYTADDGSAHLCFDLSHPDAQEWIRGVFDNVKAWGYDYIKIDFLFAGAYEGVRHNSSYTGTMALMEGLRIIRDAMGDETYIDGCGSPMLPGIGIYDGNRIGGDICFGAADAIYRLGVDLSSVTDEQGLMNWPQLVWECRNVAARYFAGGAWYHNDPDVIIVRPPYTTDEAKTLTTACIMSGGVTMLSDKLYALTNDRTAMVNDAEIYALVKGKSVVPLDLFDHADPCVPSGTIAGTGHHPTIDQLPQVWHMKIDDNTSAVALFNWGTQPAIVSLDLTQIGHSGASYTIYDMWTKDDLGSYSGSYSVPLLPHAVQLVKLTREA